MRRFIIQLILLLGAFNATAQTSRNVGIELLGVNSIRFDSRLKGNNGLGYNVGVGYGHADIDHMEEIIECNDILIPLEFNYLYGKKNSYLVFGVGIINSITLTKSTPASTAGDDWKSDRSHDYLCTPFLDMAYRYQRPKALSLSFGLKPCLSRLLRPYLSIGWSF